MSRKFKGCLAVVLVVILVLLFAYVLGILYSQKNWFWFYTILCFIIPGLVLLLLPVEVQK